MVFTFIVFATISESMSPSRQNYIVSSAVALGAFLLFGPLTYVMVVHASEIIGRVAGVNVPFTGTLGLIVSLSAILIALAVVTEITRVRLHGYAELGRGTSGRQLVRHILLVVPVVAALIVAGEFIYEMFHWGLARESVVILGIVAIVVLALTFMIVRSSTAFYRAWRQTVSS